jgi:hypothetical protein
VLFLKSGFDSSVAFVAAAEEPLSNGVIRSLNHYTSLIRETDVGVKTMLLVAEGGASVRPPSGPAGALVVDPGWSLSNLQAQNRINVTWMSRAAAQLTI